jgi:hypothetical protein
MLELGRVLTLLRMRPLALALLPVLVLVLVLAWVVVVALLLSELLAVIEAHRHWLVSARACCVCICARVGTRTGTWAAQR